MGTVMRLGDRATAQLLVLSQVAAGDQPAVRRRDRDRERFLAHRSCGCHRLLAVAKWCE